MTTIAAFIGGWGLLLIAVVIGLVVSVPLIIIAVVIFFVRQRNSRERQVAEFSSDVKGT